MATVTDIATLIMRSPDICGVDLSVRSTYRPHIAGTRISVQQIALLHQQGLSATDILAEYDVLNLAQVYAALAYYYANQEEIETYLKEEAAEYDRLVAEQSVG
jgi:uncharacterized protein (DUF433 family)